MPGNREWPNEAEETPTESRGEALPGRSFAPPLLVRALGLFGLTAVSLNGVIGSGIFVLPATVAALQGSASPLAYLIAALATSLIVLCFAEAGSIFERTGGPYLYAREAFGAFIGFEVGWMFLLTRLAAAAAISNAFASYLGYVWPPLGSGAGRIIAITFLLGSLACLNVLGVRHGAWIVNLLTIAKLIPILLFIAAGLFFADPERYEVFAFPDDARGLRQAILLLMFAYGGFENASVPSEETKNPRENLPIALILSISFTAILYILIQIVALGTLPELATDPTPLASAARNFLGPSGAAILTLGAILSTSGSMSALILVGPRILFAFGEGGQLPALLARVHPRYRTPHVSVIVFTLATWVISIQGNFAQLVAMSAIARLVFSGATCLAVLGLRRKMPLASRGFGVPGGAVIPVAAAGLCLWLLAGINLPQALAGLSGLLIGVILYLLLRQDSKQTG